LEKKVNQLQISAIKQPYLSDAPQNEISELINHADKIAEIHNTLRKGVNLSLLADA